MNDATVMPLARLQRVLIMALLVSVAITAVTGAVVVLSDTSDRTTAATLGSFSIITLGLGLVVAFAAVLRRDRRMFICAGMIGGALLAAVSVLLVLMLIFELIEDNQSVEFVVKASVIGFGLSLVLAVSGAMAQVRTASWLIRGMAIGTVACVSLASGLVALMLLFDDLTDDFGMAITLGLTVAILTLLTIIGSVAVPLALVSRAGRHQHAAESIDSRVLMHFSCPKCGERQSHRPGFVKCLKCAAGMFIEVEEPRCECGYLLYRLTGETCPECGRAVTNVARAAGAG